MFLDTKLLKMALRTSVVFLGKALYSPSASLLPGP